MTLRAAYDSLDQVPEPLRGFYVAQGSRVVLNVPDAEDVFAAGLKAKNGELLGKVKSLSDKFGDLDPEAARAAMAKVAEMEEKRQRDAGEFDSLKGQLVKAHGEEKARLESQIKELNDALYDAHASATLTTAISDADGYPIALEHHLRPFVKVEKNGKGKYEAVVVDENGNRRIKGGDGSPMTIKDLVAEFKAKPEYAFGFKGSGSSGGGAPSGGRVSNGSGLTVTDMAGFLKNIDGVAKGEVKVAIGR